MPSIRTEHDLTAWLIRLWPDEPTPVQTLGEQAQAIAVPEYDLDQIGLAAPEGEQVTRERVGPQHPLDQHGQPIHPLAHVGHAGGYMYLDP
jgi:hypothetical protein